MLQVGQKVFIKIEKISKGGFGVGRLDNFVVFVPFSAPGDELTVEITADKKTYAFAEIQKIENPGPDRIEAPCSIYEKCGGCNLQHLKYSAQVKQKELIVTESLKNVIHSQTKVFPIIESPKQWRYRNRIQLKYKKPDLGFYQRGTHNIIPVSDCPIVEEALCQVLPDMQRDLLKSGQEKLDRFEIFLSQEEKILTSQARDRFQSSPFSQVNRFVNELLIEKVLDWGGTDPYESIFDFYAGSGNFSFPLVKKYPKAKTTAVEFSEESVLSALEKCQKDNVSSKKLQFFTADVGLFLKRTFPKGKKLVLLDPPRAGCAIEVVRALSTWDDTRILYVSCDPVSLARDLAQFREANSHWKVSRIQPFDMFPQTDHVETLAELIID